MPTLHVLRRVAPCVLLVALGLVLPDLAAHRAVAGAASADGTWEQLAVASPVTPGRHVFHAAIYDPVDDRMLVFGGVCGSDLPDDVWALPLSGAASWTKLTVAGTAPWGREGHTAIYDPVRARMLVYGDLDEATDVVWALSLTGTPTWTQLVTSGAAPPARGLHTAVYDSQRDRMIIFGGKAVGSGYGDLDDVWALSLSGTPTWTNITPPWISRHDSPYTRAYHTAIYDPVGDRMLVYAGEHDLLWDRGELWALSLSGTPAWSALSGTGGSFGYDVGWASGAICDPVRQRVVIFGGEAGNSLNSVLAYSLTGSGCWTELSPAGPLPSPRRFHTAVYDSRRNRMVVFGGEDHEADGAAVVDSLLDDTWALNWGSTVPVQLALVGAEAEPWLARLTWYAAEGNGLGATVYRRSETSAWSALGTIASDGTGRLVYEDRTVVPGTRYGYRLGVSENGVESYLGEAWVEVPVAAAFALAGAEPNPSVRELRVAFSLPDGVAARLEAYDVTGRRVAQAEVGGLGAGRHVVKLGGELRSGVYLVRLTRGERTLTTRAVVVR